MQSARLAPMTLAAAIMSVGLSTQINQTGENAANAIVGLWDTRDGAHVEIYIQENKYYGKFTYFYAEPPADGVDSKHPDPTLRDRPLIGTNFIVNFEFTEEKWKHGRIYNPENGKYYKADLELKDGTLKVRGWIGFRLLGRTVEWKRLE